MKTLIPMILSCLLMSCSDNETNETSTTGNTSTSTSLNPTETQGHSSTSFGSSTTTMESSTTSITSTTSTTESSTSEIIPVCGNSIVEFPEECDEGVAGTGTATCTYNCTISFCGDNIVNPLDGEQCDGGNSCDANCQVTRS